MDALASEDPFFTNQLWFRSLPVAHQDTQLLTGCAKQTITFENNAIGKGNFNGSGK